MPGIATTTRRPAHCSKHAYAPSAPSRPRNGLTGDVTLPAQRHQTCLGRAGLASESPVAGDDPVNGSDPSGDCTSGTWWCDALHSVGGGVTGVAECLGNSGCFSPEGLANAAAGFANQATHLVDDLICSSNSNDGGYCPTWSVGTPFPCSSPGSYQVGEGLFFGVSAYAGGELADGGDAAVNAAAGEAEESAASTSSIQETLARLRGPNANGVYEVNTSQEIYELWDELSKGGTPLNNSYPGPFVRLPDGTTVGFRLTSKWGGPTLDIAFPGERPIGVHLP